jgi:hypothetical protein
VSFGVFTTSGLTIRELLWAAALAISWVRGRAIESEDLA